MKLRFLFIVLFLPAVCLAFEITDYRVEGKLKGSLKGKYAYLQIFSRPGEKAQFLQALIHNRSFVFTGKIKYNLGEYRKATLFVSDKPGLTSKDIVMLMKTTNYDYRHIMLEKRVVIEIDHSVKEAIVEDGLSNIINDQFEKILLKERNEFDNISKDFDEQKKKYVGNAEEVKRIDAEQMQKIMSIQDERIYGLLEIVKQYPNSKQSLDIFRLVAHNNENRAGKYQQQLLTTWDVLPEDIKLSKQGKEIAKLIANAVDENPLRQGVAIPDHTFKYDDIKSVSIKDFRGKYLFLDFWTSWCSPCIAEHYYMKKALARFTHKPFAILQVSLDDSKEKWLKALEKEKLPWQSLRNIKGWDKEFEILFNIKGVPTNYLIGPDGVIIARDLRGEELERKLSEIFDSR